MGFSNKLYMIVAVWGWQHNLFGAYMQTLGNLRKSFSSKAFTSRKHLYHAPLAMLTDSFIHIDISPRCSVLFATAPGNGLPALANAER